MAITICRGVLDDISEVAQIKLFALMNFSKSTVRFRDETIELGHFSGCGFTMRLIKA